MKLASAWEARASRIWAWWAETPACDVTGRFDFATFQALVLVSSLESGDVLAIRRRKEGRTRLLGLALRLLEADYLSNPQFGPDTDRLAGGVEINEPARADPRRPTPHRRESGPEGAEGRSHPGPVPSAVRRPGLTHCRE